MSQLDGFASRLFAGDPTLWGADAESEASIRLGWVFLPESSRGLLEQIEQARAALVTDDIRRIVLCGMGGSSLGAETVWRNLPHDLDLVVLDSSHPDAVRAAMTDLESTIVVIASKSGTTAETDCQRRVLEAEFAARGIEPVDRVAIITDPGSPLDDEATAAGYRVFRADPQVGGRFAVLSAFGLVAPGLAGADVGQLLDQAANIADQLAADTSDNPSVRLATHIADAVAAGTTTLAFVADQLAHPGFGAWAEQLIAESTGKDGKGVLPLVVDSIDDLPESDDVIVAPDLGVPLGASFLAWEAATAMLGRLLDINPFDQPDVESAKAAAREFLDGNESPPIGHDLDPAALRELANGVGEDDYLSIQAYLDPQRHGEFSELRDLLQRQLARPVTFGWGPRFLHSTGQLHKGGPATGHFIQVTDEPNEDLAIPGQDFTFRDLILAQAAGDARVLTDRGRPVVRIHLRDVDAAREQLRDLFT